MTACILSASWPSVLVRAAVTGFHELRRVCALLRQRAASTRWRWRRLQQSRRVPPCAAPTRCGLLPPVNGRIARTSYGGGSQRCAHAAGRLPDFDARYAKAGQAPPPPPPPPPPPSPHWPPRALAPYLPLRLPACVTLRFSRCRLQRYRGPWRPSTSPQRRCGRRRRLVWTFMPRQRRAPPAPSKQASIRTGCRHYACRPPRRLAWSLRRRCRAARRRG